MAPSDPENIGQKEPGCGEGSKSVPTAWAFLLLQSQPFQEFTNPHFLHKLCSWHTRSLTLSLQERKTKKQHFSLQPHSLLLLPNTLATHLTGCSLLESPFPSSSSPFKTHFQCVLNVLGAALSALYTVPHITFTTTMWGNSISPFYR